MFHACFIPIATCFASTLRHFYTFFGTNLLTRCRSASYCFLLFLYSRKASLEIFSELDENLRRPLFYQKTPWARRTSPGEARGPHTIPRRGRGARAATWCGCHVALLRLSSGLRLRVGKIGTWPFVSCNSENISGSNFLKPKTAENRELALWHLVNRLVPENA